MSYYIGVDLGGTFVKFGAVDESGNILKKDKIPTPAAAITEPPCPRSQKRSKG